MVLHVLTVFPDFEAYSSPFLGGQAAASSCGATPASVLSCVLRQVAMEHDVPTPQL
jgi:hypothetical protein